MPSIQNDKLLVLKKKAVSFKPYYNWNAFNTKEAQKAMEGMSEF